MFTTLGSYVSQNYSDVTITFAREYFLNRHLSPDLINNQI